MRLSSLQIRLFILIALLLVPLIGLRLLNSLEERNLAKARIQDSAGRVAHLIVLADESSVISARQLLDTLAALPRIPCRGFFDELLKKNGESYFSFALLDRNGQQVCGAGSVSGVRAPEESGFAAARETNAFAVGSYRPDPATGRLGLCFARPYRSGQFLSTCARLDSLAEIANRAELPDGASLRVFDDSGLQLSRWPIGLSGPDEPLNGEFLRAMSDPSRQGQAIEESDGLRRIFGFASVSGPLFPSQVFVAVGIPETAALEKVDRIFYRSVLATVLALLVAMAITGSYSYGRIAAPLLKIIDTANRLGAGDLDARAAISSGTQDIDELGTAFDEMAESIAIRTRQLQLSHQELEKQRSIHLNALKLAAIGGMAVQVSHEINNPLSIINLNCRLLQKNLRTNRVAIANRIEAAVGRIDLILDEMRRLSGEPRPEPVETVPVNEVLCGALSDYRERVAERNIPIFVNQSPGLVVRCRRTELQQAVGSLLDNSLDAIESKSERWVELSVSEIADSVEISVADSGEGIVPEVRERMFDPFFTTKDIGNGVGLNLSIAKVMIERHRGTLRYDSNYGNTRFVIRLPKEKAEAEC